MHLKLKTWHKEQLLMCLQAYEQCIALELNKSRLCLLLYQVLSQYSLKLSSSESYLIRHNYFWCSSYYNNVRYLTVLWSSSLKRQQLCLNFPYFRLPLIHYNVCFEGILTIAFFLCPISLKNLTGFFAGFCFSLRRHFENKSLPPQS